VTKLNFEGQVAIVTGAGGGMGREIALLLAKRQAKVFVNDYGGDGYGKPGTSARADAVVDEITATGGVAISNAIAVGSADAARAICAATMEAFGRIDILVNNAGVIAEGKIGYIADEAVDRLTEINFAGPFHLVQAVWPVMTEQRYGRILNMTSSAIFGVQDWAIYAASKAALIGLTTSAAAEGAELGIIANSVMPMAHTRLVSAEGPSEKAMPPEVLKWLQDNFKPEQIAVAVAALVSREWTASGEHFSTGGGRISRIAHVGSKGFFDKHLTSEGIIEQSDPIRNLENARTLVSSIDDIRGYMDAIPLGSP
jgi:NAD(P)-dependent dehydrogenase (short-subunit alcohol dehydrogenase family)